MNITVLTGGSSAERDVAVASAVQMVAALRSRGHQVVVVDTVNGLIPAREEAVLLSRPVGVAPPPTEHLVERERDFLLTKMASVPAVRDAAVVCLALHGGRGEDGSLQAILEMLDVPYTGSNAIGSAIAMDKDLSKRLFRDAGIPTAAWMMAPVSAHEAGATLGWPLVVKPSKQGSTVGLSVVKVAAQFDSAVALAQRYDDEVMIEAFVPGREITVGILDGTPLAVGEIVPRHEIFDYECKYTPGMAKEIFPAQLASEVAARCQELALAAHQALKLGGYSRVDFRLPDDGGPICLEVNTLPGMTATSLLPQSAAAAGVPFPELCERICLGARSRSKV